MNRGLEASMRSSGFTLLELMVAITLTVMLLLWVVRMVSISVAATGRTLDRLEHGSDLERIRQLMESDLQSAWAEPGWPGKVWLEMPTPDGTAPHWALVPVEDKPNVLQIASPVAVGESMERERWGRRGLTAAWLVHDPLKGWEDPGGLKAVGYQIVRINIVSGSEPRYYLTRSEVSAWQTLEAGYDLSAGLYLREPRSAFPYWSPPVLRHPNASHIVATNVIDFGMRAFRWDPARAIWEQVFPGDPDAVALAGFPELWVVMLRRLSNEGAVLIENLEQGRTQGDWWQVALQHSEVITFRVLRER